MFVFILCTKIIIASFKIFTFSLSYSCSTSSCSAASFFLLNGRKKTNFPRTTWYLFPFSYKDENFPTTERERKKNIYLLIQNPPTFYFTFLCFILMKILKIQCAEARRKLEAKQQKIIKLSIPLWNIYLL